MDGVVIMLVCMQTSGAMRTIGISEILSPKLYAQMASIDVEASNLVYISSFFLSSFNEFPTNKCLV